jgi:SAM-dependent methyltransferase
MTDPRLMATFQRRFREDPDPWQFEHSAYEHAKRAATLRACGSLAGRSVLELGAANGVLAAQLAHRARGVVAVEGAPAAAALARERVARQPHVAVVEGLIPFDVPSGPYDVVVASEILYYLDHGAYTTTLRSFERWLAPQGRLVAVHWRPVSGERPRSADTVHVDLARLPFLTLRERGDTDDYRLSVLDRR